MNKLLYLKPAKKWREALPIGNGYTGVMIYGGKRKETLCFNDGTLWSGYPKDYNNPESLTYLNKVRRLIFEGRHKAAEALAEDKMKGFYSEAFLPLGQVKILFSGLHGGKYSRGLDLKNGIHTVKTGNVTRESFASNPENMVCYRATSSNHFNARISAKSKLHFGIDTKNGFTLFGRAPDYAAPNYLRTERKPIRYNENKGMAFALCCKIKTDGRIVQNKKILSIQMATCIELYFSTATGYNGFHQMPETDTAAVIQRCWEKLITEKTYEQIKAEHIADFSRLFLKSTVSFSAGGAQPTDKLLKTCKNTGVSPALAELFYNFGKYMIISGSRKGGQPLNLQGLWNKSVRPPWSSNYTVNINTQMNYWGVSRANLGECAEPLLDMVYEAMQNGRKTAEMNYGCKGFACNHNVDIWRKTPPVQGSASYMLEPLCGVWLANEVYSHFKNGALRDQKAKVVEITREAALFCSEYLVKHNGKYVICPSASAENSFMSGKDTCSLDYASAFDMGLVRQSFKNYLELEENSGLTEKINAILPGLYEFQVGENGICEYHTDYEMPERGHRHFSPLYAFYPANIIGYYGDQSLRKAVEQLFHDRISRWTQHIGWSAAWGICLAARLHDCENVQKIIQSFLSHAVFKNLFCVHPPFYFQIDGNLGFVAAVHEILVYEEQGIIELLPALPENMKNGKAEHLLVNGTEISFQWQNGKVTYLSSSNPIKIRNKNLDKQIKTNENIEIMEE